MLQRNIQGLHLDADFGNLHPSCTQFAVKAGCDLTQLRSDRTVLGVDENDPRLEIGNPTGPDQRSRDQFFE